MKYSSEINHNYNNTQIELLALQQLKLDYPTSDKQMDRINQLINEFGDKKIDDKKVATDQINIKTQKPILQTIVGAKNDVLDIMCLAQLIFTETGNKKIVREMLIKILSIDPEEVKHPKNLTYLQKCLTNFKPSIYKNLKEHFAEKYEIDRDKIIILPKTTGQQVGAKVVIPDPQNKENIKVFYVKSHQEFSSKSDPQLGTRTSNGLGYVDLKELFMYKVLEKIGYGPKTEFIIDKDVSQTGVEEGIMIVTQDSGYTKNPLNKDKSFKTFEQVLKDGIELQSVSNETRKDIVAIDMLSRAFLLDDIMVNDGNFGMVKVLPKNSNEAKIKWEIVDFMSPKVKKGKEYLGDKKYEYTNHYGGSNIVHGFRAGNFSHTYTDDSPINKILADKNSKELWRETVNSINNGKNKGKMGVEVAFNSAFEEIIKFLDDNEELLKCKNKDQTTRRISDLEVYRNCIIGNWQELSKGILEQKDYLNNNIIKNI